MMWVHLCHDWRWIDNLTWEIFQYPLLFIEVVKSNHADSDAMQWWQYRQMIKICYLNRPVVCCCCCSSWILSLNVHMKCHTLVHSTIIMCYNLGGYCQCLLFIYVYRICIWKFARFSYCWSQLLLVIFLSLSIIIPIHFAKFMHVCVCKCKIILTVFKTESIYRNVIILCVWVLGSPILCVRCAYCTVCISLCNAYYLYKFSHMAPHIPF